MLANDDSAVAWLITAPYGEVAYARIDAIMDAAYGSFTAG